MQTSKRETSRVPAQENHQRSGERRRRTDRRRDARLPRQDPRIEGTGAIVRNEIADGKVGLVIGGGSGHEPLFPGMVGENLADAAACGGIFAAPTPDTILAAIKAADRGRGALLVYGNYAGDNMNFDMAAELAEAEGIETRTVRVWDDVAAAPKAEIDQRRGSRATSSSSRSPALRQPPSPTSMRSTALRARRATASARSACRSAQARYRKPGS